MVLDVDKETLSVNQILGTKKESIWIEGDVIVPDVKPDILNTISTTGNIVIYKSEILDGKIKIDGCVNSNIMYLADSDKSVVRGLNATLDFSQTINFEKAKSKMGFNQKATIKEIDCKVLNGRKVQVKANVEFEFKIFSNNTVEILKEIDKIEDMQCLKRNLDVKTLIGEGSQRAFAKDTITLDEGVVMGEILKSEVKIINKDIKISYNKVLAKADAQVKILYISEDDEIKTCNSLIPVMGFVDIKDINDESTCDMKYDMRNILIKPNENNSVYVEIEVEILARAYESKKIDIIDDLYSPCSPISFNSRQLTTSQQLFNIKDEFDIKQNMNIPDFENSTIYDVSAQISINNQNIIEQRLMIDGVAKVSVIYSSNSMAKIDTRIIDIPYEFTTTLSNVATSSNIESNIDVQDIDFIVMPNNDIDIKIKTMFNVEISTDVKINIIDEINLLEDRKQSDSSMIIYYVKKGDTLWNIAKKFNSTIECILAANELISDPNDLKVAMQIFIPRYTGKKNMACA